jgi:site-specific recombinase XerD
MLDFADGPAPATLDVDVLPLPAARLAPALPLGEQLLEHNLYAVCELVAGRAARASSARQYGAIYTRFCDALRDELGRPPVVADVTADAVAAYSRALERRGGRGGGPASPATRRAHITMLRALLAQLGRDDVAAGVRVPTHRVGPPETFTAAEYGNVIRAPDRRTLVGKRDHAMLRLMGDCGLRNAELRALTMRAIRRPRANSAYHHLFVRGKGDDVEREIPIPTATYKALEAWLRAHPQRHGGGLRDDNVIFVSLARAGSPGAMSQQALAKLVRRYAAVAGVPERLAHPHALRGYYATTLAGENVPIQEIKARLGHASIETTARYLAELADSGVGVGHVLDRHHEFSAGGEWPEQRRRRRRASISVAPEDPSAPVGPTRTNERISLCVSSPPKRWPLTTSAVRPRSESS